MRRWELDDFSEEGGATGVGSEGQVTGAVNWQKAMNALEMEEWRKVWRKKKCMVARRNGKHVIGARVVYKRKNKGSEVEKYGCRLNA